MKDLYYVAQEISKQKNLKGNLLKYATGMASMYTGLAYMKLSMNYYTVYDMRQENATVNPVFEELLATTNGVIDKLLSGQAEDVTEVETVRNRLIETMEVVTQYVDCLRIYEYVLNRVECIIFLQIKIMLSLTVRFQKLWDSCRCVFHGTSSLNI